MEKLQKSYKNILRSIVENNNTSSQEDKLKMVQFFVEANSFEHHILWKETRNRIRKNNIKLIKNSIHKLKMELIEDFNEIWIQDYQGITIQVGEIEIKDKKYPVTVGFDFATIYGKYVCFYNGCSQVVDHKMIRSFIQDNYPLKYDDNSRWAMTDANNFHHCLNFCRESRKK